MFSKKPQNLIRKKPPTKDQTGVDISGVWKQITGTFHHAGVVVLGVWKQITGDILDVLANFCCGSGGLGTNHRRSTEYSQ